MEAAEGWLEGEWLGLNIYGGSDPGPETVYFQNCWYNEKMGEWTFGGITYDEAREAGWGDIWRNLMQDYA